MNAKRLLTSIVFLFISVMTFASSFNREDLVLMDQLREHGRENEVRSVPTLIAAAYIENGVLTVEVLGNNENYQVQIEDVYGLPLQSKMLRGSDGKCQLSIKNLRSGEYTLTIVGMNTNSVINGQFTIL